MRPTFEHAVNTAIATNSATVVWDFIAANQFVEHIELGCLGVFVAELFVRLHRAGWNGVVFWRDRWTAFDMVVIGLALLPVLGVDTSLLRIARLSRTVHWLRHVGHLRWLRVSG